MADLTALLRVVIAAPDLEAPRLAYATAVAPSDPERAELINVQLMLASCRKTHTTSPERHAALLREEVLIRTRGAAWASDVKPLVAKWQFLRGFVEVVTLDAASFLARALELYRKAPILHLDLTDVAAHAAALFASPHLARIQSLNLSGTGLADAEAIALARSPHLAKLRWLDLSRNQIGAAGLDALAASDQLPNLRYLGFAWNQVADPTPAHADEYDATSAAAAELQQKHGARAWLDARPRPEWPPARDAL